MPTVRCKKLTIMYNKYVFNVYFARYDLSLSMLRNFSDPDQYIYMLDLHETHMHTACLLSAKTSFYSQCACIKNTGNLSSSSIY